MQPLLDKSCRCVQKQTYDVLGFALIWHARNARICLPLKHDILPIQVCQIYTCLCKWCYRSNFLGLVEHTTLPYRVGPRMSYNPVNMGNFSCYVGSDGVGIVIKLTH